MKFSRKWLKHKRIAVDTSFLIPLLADRVEAESVYEQTLHLAESKSMSIVTSTVTLLELLVQPYRSKDYDFINYVYGHLTQSDLVSLIPVDADIADRAAEFRARYQFKTPDAIQLATAVRSKATLLLTLDKDFKRQREIEIGCPLN